MALDQSRPGPAASTDSDSARSGRQISEDSDKIRLEPVHKQKRQCHPRSSDSAGLMQAGQRFYLLDERHAVYDVTGR